jgi:hypothetical protein
MRVLWTAVSAAPGVRRTGVFSCRFGRGYPLLSLDAEGVGVTTVVRKSESTVLVTQQAVGMVREVLRAVATGERVDNAACAAQAAYALAALPPSPRQGELVA